LHREIKKNLDPDLLQKKMLNQFRIRNLSSFKDLESRLRPKAEALISGNSFGSTFDYYRPGARVKPRYHKLSFSEKEREEVKLWQANLQEPLKSSKYSVSSSSSSFSSNSNAVSDGPLTSLAAEVASLTAADVGGVKTLSELRSRYKHTLPVFLLVSAIQKLAREPIHILLKYATTTTINSGTDGIALAASVTAPPSPEEEAFLKDESGREKLLEMASISLSNATNAYYVHSISRTKEGEINERAALLLACLRSFRVNCLVQYARFSSLPVEEIFFEETRWLSSLNITLPSERFETTRSTSSLQQRESRSPRIPASLFRVQDTPFEAPLTLEERRNDAHILSRSVTKRLALEHRDRSEFVTRRRLPRPLHLDASNESNEPLESAARALDENSSLSDVDRQYMLGIVSKALSQKKPEQFADESFLLNDDEHKAWKEPQPQWGWFDPNFAKVQDDVDDALKGRGQFSRYRGLDYQSEHIVRPEDIGERAPGGLPAGTPLETIEAAVVASADAEAAVRLAAAPKGVKITISSPVSNKARKPFADSVPSSRFTPIRLEVAKAAPAVAPAKKK